VRTEFQIGDVKFKMKGQNLIEMGFLEIMQWQIQGDKEVPQFEVGDIVDIK